MQHATGKIKNHRSTRIIARFFGGFHWKALTKKIPAINAGRRFNNKKPAVRDLLTAGVVRPEGFEPPAFGIGINLKKADFRWYRSIFYDT